MKKFKQRGRGQVTQQTTLIPVLNSAHIQEGQAHLGSGFGDADAPGTSVRTSSRAHSRKGSSGQRVTEGEIPASRAGDGPAAPV